MACPSGRRYCPRHPGSQTSRYHRLPVRWRAVPRYRQRQRRRNLLRVATGRGRTTQKKSQQKETGHEKPNPWQPPTCSPEGEHAPGQALRNLESKWLRKNGFWSMEHQMCSWGALQPNQHKQPSVARGNSPIMEQAQAVFGKNDN